MIRARPGASDPGAGQVPDRETLLDQRLAALEVNAIMDRYLQVERVDLRQLEEARVAEQAAGDADLDVVLNGGPDGVGLLDLNPVTIPQEMEIILDGMFIGPGAEDVRPCAVKIPGRLLERAQPGERDDPARFFPIDFIHDFFL